MTTESLLQKLEEKMMSFMEESEGMRNKIKQLEHENSNLKMEKDSHAKKLQDLLSLFESVSHDNSSANLSSASIAAVKPMLVQA